MNNNDDRALLRRFEPVIRYTRGEQFYPMDVGPYIANCSLWVQRPNQLPLRLLPEGEVTLENLAEPRNHGFDSVYYLRFIEPLNITEMAALRLRERDAGETFQAGWGRLARVGYGSRFVDALFSLSLLTRGRVPGDTAAAAERAYRRIMEQSEGYCYYGRVVRQNGWVALQYCFFYAYNSWRSGFYGANDHEGDWEIVYVYLYEEGDSLCPEWVAYAAHDYYGDDLRRRWDDPELEKVGEHPVIYAGAGSHANYFQRGEYLAELELPFLSPAMRVLDRIQEFWERNFRLYPVNRSQRSRWSEFSIFRVPFVDYARGDGVSVGPGQQNEWGEPRLLAPTPAWASQYRGLWGLYTRDPFSGEDAPAGPLYNRDGTVRYSWYDPLGWAGLDKVPPPNRRLVHVRSQQAEIAARRTALEDQIEVVSQELTGLGVELAAMQGQPHMKPQRDAHQRRIADLSAQRTQLKGKLADDATLAQTLALYAERIASGQRAASQAHLSRAHRPASPERLRLNRFAEAWAAISTGLMIISFVILVLFASQYLIFGLVALVSLLVFIEATFRRRVARLISSVTVALAIVSALVLLFAWFWQIVVAAVLVAGGYIMVENIRELRR